MKLIAKLAFAALALNSAALAAIEMGTPLVSCNVATLENNHETSRRELSVAQLHALSDWLSQHRSGWHGLITEASSEPQRLEFSVKDTAGNSGSIAVVARADGGFYLRFISTSKKWSYRSFGGLFKFWAGRLNLTPGDLQQLRAAVGLPDRP